MDATDGSNDCKGAGIAHAAVVGLLDLATLLVAHEPELALAVRQRGLALEHLDGGHDEADGVAAADGVVSLLEVVREAVVGAGFDFGHAQGVESLDGLVDLVRAGLGAAAQAGAGGVGVGRGGEGGVVVRVREAGAPGWDWHVWGRGGGRDGPVAKVGRDYKQVLGVSEILCQHGTVRLLLAGVDGADQDGNDLDGVDLASQLQDLVDVRQVHLDRVFVLVRLESHPAKLFARLADLFQEVGVQSEVA